MTLTNREKCIISILYAMNIYSTGLQDGKNSEYQSWVDCILKNIPHELRSELTMTLIDEVIAFTSEQHMKLS